MSIKVSDKVQHKGTRDIGVVQSVSEDASIISVLFESFLGRSSTMMTFPLCELEKVAERFRVRAITGKWILPDGTVY